MRMFLWRWMISQGTYGKRPSEANISYRPAMPEGWDIHTYSVEMKRLREKYPEKMSWNEELDRVHAYVSPSEIGYGQSFDEAMLIVEYLDRRDDGLPDAEESLLVNGFVLNYEHDNHRGHFKHYDHIKKKNLGVIMSSASVHMKYDTNNGWENIMRLAGVKEKAKNEQPDIIHYYTEYVGDYRKIAVAACLDIMRRRIERGGLFKIPLLEADFKHDTDDYIVYEALTT